MLNPVRTEDEIEAESCQAESERDQEVFGAVAETIGQRDPQGDEVKRRSGLAEIHERPCNRARIEGSTQSYPQRRYIRRWENRADQQVPSEKIGREPKPEHRDLLQLTEEIHGEQARV